MASSFRLTDLEEITPSSLLTTTRLRTIIAREVNSATGAMGDAGAESGAEGFAPVDGPAFGALGFLLISNTFEF